MLIKGVSSCPLSLHTQTASPGMVQRCFPSCATRHLVSMLALLEMPASSSSTSPVRLAALSCLFSLVLITPDAASSSSVACRAIVRSTYLSLSVCALMCLDVFLCKPLSMFNILARLNFLSGVSSERDGKKRVLYLSPAVSISISDNPYLLSTCVYIYLCICMHLFTLYLRCIESLADVPTKECIP